MLKKMQRVSASKSHDRPLRIDAWSCAKETSIGNVEIVMSVYAAERIGHTKRFIFAHWATGEKVDGHKARAAVRERSGYPLQVIGTR